MPTPTNEPPPKFLENACDATRILSKRRQLYDIKEKVAVEKENFDRQSLILLQKEDELTKREIDFQAKLAKFDSINREKAPKQAEFERRLAEEMTICGNLDREASILTQTLKERNDILEKLKERG